MIDNGTAVPSCALAFTSRDSTCEKSTDEARRQAGVLNHAGRGVEFFNDGRLRPRGEPEDDAVAFGVGRNLGNRPLEWQAERLGLRALRVGEALNASDAAVEQFEIESVAGCSDVLDHCLRRGDRHLGGRHATVRQRQAQHLEARCTVVAQEVYVAAAERQTSDVVRNVRQLPPSDGDLTPRQRGHRRNEDGRLVLNAVRDDAGHPLRTGGGHDEWKVRFGNLHAGLEAPAEHRTVLVGVVPSRCRYARLFRYFALGGAPADSFWRRL